MANKRIRNSLPSTAASELRVSRLSTYRAPLAVLIMLLGVITVYWPPPAQPNSILIGADYLQLHSRRMQFARDALFGLGVLPAWYSRELLGTPFWANIQNFPFIPTRLLVLLTMEPNGPNSYAFAIGLSAALAALFMYLYLRKIGMGLIGSAAAGWTFACSGFYASRVAAGHLPLLEAYLALPLLLWAVESLVQSLERGEIVQRWFCAVAISSTCVMLAGHPQLPAYSMLAASLYALWRSGYRRALRVWAAMALGVGIAAFALVPMALLIGRSTRVLTLAPALNDLAMPYARLAGFLFPWRDGFPPLLDPNGAQPFRGYPNLAYFWDTVCYTGLLPWIAIALLGCFVTRIKLDDEQAKPITFLAVLGLAGIVFSLPFVQQASYLLPGTILRSPARLIYLTVFALAAGLGAGVHAAIANVRPRTARVVVPMLLSIHAVDLGIDDRRFILRGALLSRAESDKFSEALKNLGDGRVAIDYAQALQVNRTIDDVGFFDSIMLARPYRTILSLDGAPRDLNIQTLNGSELSLRALTAAGVRIMLTTKKREDLTREGEIFGIGIYRIPSPFRRAEFFGNTQVRYLSADEIHAVLRDPGIDLRSLLLLPPEAAAAGEPKIMLKPGNEYREAECRRPNSDQLDCMVATGESGFLRVIESWDPGWSATVNGSPVPIYPAMDALLAVPIEPGQHEVRFIYRTPGAVVGRTISIISLTLLFGLMGFSELKRQRQI
jgi:hypothetical protein